MNPRIFSVLCVNEHQHDQDEFFNKRAEIGRLLQNAPITLEPNSPIRQWYPLMGSALLINDDYVAILKEGEWPLREDQPNYVGDAFMSLQIPFPPSCQTCTGAWWDFNFSHHDILFADTAGNGLSLLSPSDHSVDARQRLTMWLWRCLNGLPSEWRPGVSEIFSVDSQPHLKCLLVDGGFKIVGNHHCVLFLSHAVINSCRHDGTPHVVCKRTAVAADTSTYSITGPTAFMDLFMRNVPMWIRSVTQTRQEKTHETRS